MHLRDAYYNAWNVFEALEDFYFAKKEEAQQKISIRQSTAKELTPLRQTAKRLIATGIANIYPDTGSTFTRSSVLSISMSFFLSRYRKLFLILMRLKVSICLKKTNLLLVEHS
ncbi:hypothetical protein [Providencia heimbachae]|uniref:hypothetical protein n=1 Tax=Providencia heimbachae TaxID=333962 RepID=UPI0011AEA52E|nr:hypothetical protein [Providencia heimbachae]